MATPGIGTVLFAAIRQADWFLIQGAVFTVIVAIGLATLISISSIPSSIRASHTESLEMSVTPQVGGSVSGPLLATPGRGAPRREPRLVKSDRVGGFVRYLRRNKSLPIGMLMLLSLVLFSVVGSLLVRPRTCAPRR